MPCKEVVAVFVGVVVQFLKSVRMGFHLFQSVGRGLQLPKSVLSLQLL